MGKEKKTKRVETAEEKQRAKGNTKLIVSCVVLVLFAIAFVWFRAIVDSYFGAFMCNTSDAEDAITYIDGLYYSDEEAAQLLPLQKDWDFFRESHLWEQADIDASADGIRLHAQYYDAGSDTTVILLHRFHEDSTGDYLLGSMFGEMGYNLVLPDARAHGDSEGDYLSYGYMEQYDLNDWITWTKQTLAPTGSIILYGEGMGAETILFAEASGNLDGSVAFAVLESPFASFQEVENYTLQTFYKLPIRIFGPAFDYKLTHSDAGFTADNLELLDDLTGNETLPAIFLGGTADDYIPFEQTQQLYDAYAGDKLLISDDVRHSFVDVTKKEEIKDAVSTYVKQYGSR
jgi:hypothetical protein